jgi:hypothetical protein
MKLNSYQIFAAGNETAKFKLTAAANESKDIKRFDLDLIKKYFSSYYLNILYIYTSL